MASYNCRTYVPSESKKQIVDGTSDIVSSLIQSPHIKFNRHIIAISTHKKQRLGTPGARSLHTALVTICINPFWYCFNFYLFLKHSRSSGHDT